MKPKLLLLEDEPINALVTKLLLQEFDVTTAHTAEQALAAAADTPFEVYLLDLNVGGDCSGQAVQQQIRQLPAYAGGSFVLYTGDTACATAGMCRQMGFDDVVLKPADPATLAARLLRAAALAV